jgi:hypothetical protein
MVSNLRSLCHSFLVDFRMLIESDVQMIEGLYVGSQYFLVLI